MIYFTSDTHFGSDRTLKFSRRPFFNTADVDNQLIDSFNKVAKSEDDLIFHLGDFGDYDLIKLIKAKVVLICGNHDEEYIQEKFNGDFDKFKEWLLELGFYKVIKGDYYRSIVIDDYKVLMAHEPSKIPTEFAEDKEIHLFGHIHEKQKIKRRGLNVGVDCNDFQLVDFETVKFYTNAIRNHYDEEVFME